MSRYKGSKNRSWSKEEKLKMVVKFLSSKLSRQKFASHAGVPASNLYNWIKRYLEQGEKGLNSKNICSDLDTNKSLTDLENIQLTVIKQKIEIERLKKGYQVKGAGAEKEFVTSNAVNTKSLKK